MVNLGHKKIAHITGDLVTQAAAERLEGYKRALSKNKIPLNESFIFKVKVGQCFTHFLFEEFIPEDNKCEIKECH